MILQSDLQCHSLAANAVSIPPPENDFPFLEIRLEVRLQVLQTSGRVLVGDPSTVEAAAGGWRDEDGADLGLDSMRG